MGSCFHRALLHRRKVNGEGRQADAAGLACESVPCCGAQSGAVPLDFEATLSTIPLFA